MGVNTGGMKIKQIIRGEALINGTTQRQYITIPTIDPEKSRLTVTGMHGVTDYVYADQAQLRITSATQLEVYRVYSSTGANYLSYEITEYI